jgi:adenylate cyclase
MADVFVSYARPDERHAHQVADALRAAGYQVWRDDQLPAHRGLRPMSRASPAR